MSPVVLPPRPGRRSAAPYITPILRPAVWGTGPALGSSSSPIPSERIVIHGINRNANKPFCDPPTCAVDSGGSPRTPPEPPMAAGVDNGTPQAPSQPSMVPVVSGE
ncbi:hypothetical protein ONZ51_g8096 [Trametes cubensis]|uniref:Uncharacterized protein n=1 Tax=Trametes cubensis TaxID=1111947 RepID=A0AAD7TRG4_9APHY|nr:hypothetical protein ONZ51_g8096 [Trametes cubensis]